MKLLPEEDYSAIMTVSERRQLVRSLEGSSRIRELTCLRHLSLTGKLPPLQEIRAATLRFVAEGKTPDRPDPVGLRQWLATCPETHGTPARAEYETYAAA